MSPRPMPLADFGVHAQRIPVIVVREGAYLVKTRNNCFESGIVRTRGAMPRPAVACPGSRWRRARGGGMLGESRPREGHAVRPPRLRLRTLMIAVAVASIMEGAGPADHSVKPEHLAMGAFHWVRA